MLEALDAAGYRELRQLLTNSDRQADDGVFSRDVLDLAMMDLLLPQP